MNELQGLLGTDAFECEFGVRADGRLVLFQTRPLPDRRGRISLRRHRDAVRMAQQQLAAAARPHPQGLGREAVFGVMPDWNPAEMIGLRPRPLAMSLYRNLITDRTWAEARHRYGYRDLRRFPLMISLCGLPYIDVRASVTSLVPAGGVCVDACRGELPQDPASPHALQVRTVRAGEDRSRRVLIRLERGVE